MRGWHADRDGQRRIDERFARLTARESQVQNDLMNGLRPTEIADSARVSKFTVRSQVKSILTKLDVGSQIEAVAEARRTGWHGLDRTAPNGPRRSPRKT